MEPLSPGLALKAVSEATKLARHLSSGDYSKRLTKEIADRLGEQFVGLSWSERRNLARLFRGYDGWEALLDAVTGDSSKLNILVATAVNGEPDRISGVANIASTYYAGCLDSVDRSAVDAYARRVSDERIQSRLNVLMEATTKPPMSPSPGQSDFFAYTSILKGALHGILPKNEFDVTLIAFTSKGLSAHQELIETLKSTQRLALLGAAGSGKTSVLVRTALSLLEQNHLVIYLRLRGWTPQHLDNSTASSILTIEELLKSSLVAIKFDALNPLANLISKGRHVVWIADGINEISAAAADQIIELLSVIASGNLVSRIILSDRSPVRYKDSSWSLREIAPLSDDEVDRLLLGAAPTADLSASQRTLLRLPFFLELAINESTTTVATQSKAINYLLADRVALSIKEIDSLANGVYSALKLESGLSIQPDRFVDLVGKKIVLAMLEARMLLLSPTGQFVFYLQLIQDYLASRHLVGTRSKCGSEGFDVATLRANSFEAMIMALEQIETASEREMFLLLMYDWNWYGTIQCITDGRFLGRQYISRHLILAIAA